MAVQTIQDSFTMSTKTLDQLGRMGAYGHISRRKAAIVDIGLESVKDIAKQAELSTALAKHHANGDTSMVTEIVNLCPIM